MLSPAMAINWAHAPTPHEPYWRDVQGRRTDVQAVGAGRTPSELVQIVNEHADAVCRIIHAAGAARLGGRHAEARMLATHASKLCGELAGLWPAGSQEPLS
jgi:hypothetical protein